MLLRSKVFLLLSALFPIVFFALMAPAQNVKRLVLVKIDGLPGYYVDHFVQQRDQKTGKSVLPWIEKIFYENGTRVPNFYSRGISLSAPSWSVLDTGQHLQVKGNVEYDRYTQRTYDYLNFFNFNVGYGLSKVVDVPGVEVLDTLKIPLLSDAFPYDKRYTSGQLYGRGNDWAVIASGFVNLFPKKAAELVDEWTIGVELRKLTIDQNERDVLGKIVKRPAIDYLDYFDDSFDHVSHHNNDTASRLASLKELDQTLGKIWNAIQDSSRADETAIVLVSDHGTNSDEKVYSQGYNLVKLLTSAAGGGHHVGTKRIVLQDYSFKIFYPPFYVYRTASPEPYYLKGQAKEYLTALIDFDGNERSSIHLRNSDLNVLQILLQRLQTGKLSPKLAAAVRGTIFQIIDEHRQEWQRNIDQLSEQMDALHRFIESEKKGVIGLQTKPNKDGSMRGLAEQNRRRVVALDRAVETEAEYRKYSTTITNLLALNPSNFNVKDLKIEDLIAPGAMGDPNSIYQLQNYVVGESANGLVLDTSGRLDLEKSFVHINYFELLHDQSVRNNVQPGVSNHPIDFVAVRMPAAALSGVLPGGERFDQDPIWLFGGEDKQALVLSRYDADGGQSHRYIPVTGMRQGRDGKVTFTIAPWADGFPLKLFEDKALAIEAADRATWLGQWHSEAEWLAATHKALYSNAVIGLNEELNPHPVSIGTESGLSQDQRLLRRFYQRQRRLTEADLQIFANDHWNFDVRGFNPGANHGSFFRVSTNATLMIAGGAGTGIPRRKTVEQPYDGLSLVPTLFRLMGKIDDNNQPNAELRQLGFQTFPGPVIREITDPGK